MTVPEDTMPSFVNYRNPIDRLKPASKASTKSRCAKTIYGPGERFLMRARWGGHSGVTKEQRRSGVWSNDDNGIMQMMMQ